MRDDVTSTALTTPSSPAAPSGRRVAAGVAFAVALTLTAVAAITLAVTREADSVDSLRPQAATEADAARLAEPRAYPEQSIRLDPAPADAKPRLTAEDALKVDAGLGIYPPAALAGADRRVELALYSNDQFRQIDAEPTFQNVLAWVITYDNLRLEGAGHGGARNLTREQPAKVTYRTCTVISPVDATTGQSLNVAQACYQHSGG